MQTKRDLALAADVGAEVGRLRPVAAWEAYYAEPWVLHDAAATGGQPGASLQALHDLVKRNSAETDERLRVLADAMEQIVERLDAAQSHPRLLAPGPEVLSSGRRVYTVLIEGPEGAHTVLIPDLPHLSAHGPTFKQAVTLATAVVENWAMQELAAGRELPEPRDSHYIINDSKYDAVLRAGARPNVISIRLDGLREWLRRRTASPQS